MSVIGWFQRCGVYAHMFSSWLTSSNRHTAYQWITEVVCSVVVLLACVALTGGEEASSSVHT